MTLCLRVVARGREPEDIELSGDELVVGRASSAGLVLPDRFLSRHHTRLFRRDGAWWVEDLGSRNGTRLNHRVLEAPARLQSGDSLTLSSCQLMVYEAGEAPPTSGPPGVTTVFRPADTTSGSAPPLEHAQELSRYAERLRLLSQVHEALGRSVELGELLELILDRVFDHLGPQSAVIWLGSRPDELEAAAWRNLDGSPEPLHSQHLAQQVLERRMGALVLDARTDRRFESSESILISGFRSFLAAPLLQDGEVLGLIALASLVRDRAFTEEDLELLSTLASAAALRLHNLQLAEEALERRRLQGELDLARRIQEALIPDRLPTVEGFELGAANFPSRGVSGDLYRIHRRASGRLAVFVADVSGKGMAASLLTASLEALSAGLLESETEAAEACRQLSSWLYVRTPGEKYATAIFAVADPDTGRVAYCNAGHNPSLLVRADGSIEWLGSTGVPIGLLPGASYSAGSVGLGPGDLLVLYTDGLVEAEDPDGGEFGADRLAEVVRSHRELELGALEAVLLGQLEAFTEGAPASDDRTLVWMRRVG